MRVEFLPHERTVDVAADSPLVDAAAAAGIALDMPCGGDGTCGKCVVRIRATDDPDAPAREVLACQQKVDRPMRVEVPSTSVLSMSIRAVAAADVPSTPRPMLWIPAGRLGVAIDIGTTTLAVELIDLSTGAVLAVESAMNPQTSLGDDVIARIQHATGAPAQLAALRDLARAAVRSLVERLAATAGVDPMTIDDVTIAGNTTMQHIFCGYDVAGLARLPFEPYTREAACLEARAIGLQLDPRAEVFVPPVIGGFVGGDTLAGLLCCQELARIERRHNRPSEPALFIDIGTNGEILLLVDGRRHAAATAAGPAFEGARIGHGMRATPGAIERVAFDPKAQDLVIETIAGARPVGICGSGLIDAVAELLHTGMIESTGRLIDTAAARAALPHRLAMRRVGDGVDAAVVLADAEHARRDGPVLLTQRDIRELQLASGAIRAGILLLLRREGLDPTDLEHVYIAGGFGQHIRRSNALRIGLIPHAVRPERIRFLGNTSLAGARMMLLSKELRSGLDALARETTHVDLSTDPDFAWTFAESMLFPEPDGG